MNVNFSKQCATPESIDYLWDEWGDVLISFGPFIN